MRSVLARAGAGAAVFGWAALIAAGCGGGKSDAKAEAPPPAQVEEEHDSDLVKVDRPDQFPLFTATEHKAVTALNVTGVVNPDIARAVPVISIASGRVIELKARLGDHVEKGQVLLKVRSNDVASANQTYLKAVNDERLAHQQLERAQDLYQKGAIAKSLLEQAETAEKDATADLNAAEEQLRLLGVDKEHPSGIVDVVAPISGIITDQQITTAAGVQGFGLGTASPFTISDLSYVWIICDVYENDLDAVHMGEYADIHLNAYPGKTFKGRVDNILPVLDSNIRTTKVRLEVPNPGMIMRIGMFVTATFFGRQPDMHASIPADAILHLHDRDWVYIPAGDKQFRRLEVKSGEMLPNKMQEVLSGVKPGQQVVSNALVLQNTAEQ
jgi:cobalt-zinc-cadmium efflux system membrane fusion protein